MVGFDDEKFKDLARACPQLRRMIAETS
jgi:hypothetical protein